MFICFGFSGHLGQVLNFDAPQVFVFVGRFKWISFLRYVPFEGLLFSDVNDSDSIRSLTSSSHLFFLFMYVWILFELFKLWIFVWILLVMMFFPCISSISVLLWVFRNFVGWEISHPCLANSSENWFDRSRVVFPVVWTLIHDHFSWLLEFEMICFIFFSYWVPRG